MSSYRLAPLGAPGRELRQTFTIRVPDRLLNAFGAFAVSQGFESETQAAAALLEMSLSALPPEDALAKAIRVQAYNAFRYWLMSEVGKSLNDLKAVMDAEVNLGRQQK